MSHICGASLAVPDYWPNPEKWFGELFCCWGVVNGDYRDCSCWEPIFDLEQKPVVEAPADCRTVQCGDCAYRVDSPERQGDESVVGDDYELDRIVRTGDPFWCHQGIRRPMGPQRTSAPDGQRGDSSTWLGRGSRREPSALLPPGGHHRHTHRC